MASTRNNIAAPPAAGAATAANGSRRQIRPSKQQQVRAHLIESGLELFRHQGFEATTVAEIADAAGVSRRTFFRYFDSKDDVVFDWLDEQGDFVRKQLAAGLAVQSPPAALRSALLQLAQYLDADRPRATLLTRIVFDTASLSRRYQAENSRWEVEITELLQRKRSAAAVFELRVQVSVATAAFSTALRAWAAANHGKTLRSWVAAAFAALERALRELAVEPAKAPKGSAAKSALRSGRMTRPRRQIVALSK